MKYLTALFLMIALVFCISCKQAVKTTDNNQAEETKENMGFGEQELEEIYHRFPSPEEMLSILETVKLDYKGHILNGSEKSKDYLNSKSQALNVGVYSADLAYLTLFKKHKESTAYFESIFNLSRDLRISSAFDIKLMRRVQTNMSNPDSLKALTDFAFTKITNYLVSNNKEKTFAIISLGGFVEALYLSFNFTGEFSENNVIVQRIADQKLVLENIISYSRPYKEDPALAGAIEDIYPILEVYNQIVPETGKTVVTKTEDGKIVISGGNKITLTNELYQELKKATFDVRKKITQN